jgi:hypothetical protein
VDERQPEPVPEPIEPIEALPADLRALLLDLARRGDIKALREHAERLERGEPRHARLGARLRSLVDHFQVKAIRELLETGP